MSDVEDSKLELNESDKQTSVDSPKSDTNTHTNAGELDNKKDHDDAKRDEEKNKIQAKSVIRYSKEQLLALRGSPLVKKPDALPPISVWFEDIKKEKKVDTGGVTETEKSKIPNKSKDDIENPKSPSIFLKRPNVPAPTSPKPDKFNIINFLGPPKMNF